MSAMLPRIMDSFDDVPELIHGYVSVKSKGGKSCFSLTEVPESTEGFHGASKDAREAERVLTSMGFTIDAQSRLGMAVSAPPGAFEELTGGKVVTRDVLRLAEASTMRYVTHMDIIGAGQPETLCCGIPKSKSTGVEAVLLESPRPPLGPVFPSPMPPSPPGFYLRVPQDVGLNLGAPGAHAKGFRGAGVLVAMVDSGQYPHPFFAAHGYQVKRPIAMVAGTSPAKDPIGHGTGESANIFAVAPEAVLQPIRVTTNGGDFVKAIGGFLKAKQLRPRILTNSWGGEIPFSQPLDQASITWALEIQDAVEQGIFVVFSAGNGQFSIEPQVPEVFAAGGVFMDQAMRLSASNYSSGYRSPFFTNRIVPDACGLVGMLPRADYIMLPVQPKCELDVEMSHRDEDGNPGDGTGTGDGWARFSGTSAAAPQIAGVAAVILSAKPNLTPAQVKQAIIATSTDVTSGRCNPIFNNQATVGVDLATGAGLANTAAAVQYAISNFP